MSTTKQAPRATSEVARTLAAGGLVPATAKLAKDEVVDTVVARGYRHPVLPGRVVVRLTAEGVAAGDDLEMSVLGFGAAEARGVVGKERRRPLGFPAWALVHDPANARYALDVVGELKTHTRRAKSKPGFAKDGIDALGAKLGKSVPHFLPSFYEEAGRAFVLHGSPSYAAMFFGKAREAEDVHALEVDEQHRVDAFLEFALAGAVTTKALATYAKDLGEHHAPNVAYAHFRQLCVQRTLGGMPPWGGMAKELRRLAKTAKLDVAAEDASLVAEIVESPALGKASAELWREYEAPLIALGKASPGARATLLDLFPTATRASGHEVDEAWLDLLDAIGGVESLLASPPGAPAAWFDKLTRHLGRHYNKKLPPRTFAILRTLAPRLAADGVAVRCATQWNQIDLDLAEIALELGVALTVEQNASFKLDDWTARVGEPDGGHDPVRVAAHAVLGPILRTAIGVAIGGESFDTKSRGLAGFLAAKRTWLTEVLDRAAAGGLPGLDEALQTVRASAKASLFAELPDLHARFAALDVAPALARSLRIGLYDELGWPAFEEAALELAPDGAGVTIHGGLPAVVLASATRLVAIGARGRLGTFDLVLPAHHTFHTARFIGGQFLVFLVNRGALRGMWSSAPHDVFVLEGYQYSCPVIGSNCAVLADGAWREGVSTIRVGERKRPENRIAAFDGATAWIHEMHNGRSRLREVSEAGELGRASWPAFLETFSAEGWLLDGATSYLVPAPDGLTASPLGIANGMLGVRVRRKGETWRLSARELERIDGVRATAAVALRASGLLDLPGADAPRAVWADAHWREGSTAWIADGSDATRGGKFGSGDPRYARGSFTVLPNEMWHFMSARDDAGSRRLRAITDADARALIDAVAAGKTSEELGKLVPVDVVGAQLPAITHPRLARGVAGYVALAAQLQLARTTLAAERSPAVAAAPKRAVVADDDALIAALGGWIEKSWRTAGSVSAQLGATAAVFRSDDHSDRVVEVPTSTVDWLTFALAPGALAFLALALGTAAEGRSALVGLLDAIASSLPDPAKLRVWYATGKLDPALPGGGAVGARWHGGNAYLVAEGLNWNSQTRVLEYAPSGTFRGLPGLELVFAWAGGAPLADGEIAAVAAAVAAGATSWADDGPAKLAAATGITPSEGAYLLAGCPNSREYGTNFLEKDLREAMGLKAAQAALARDTLNAVTGWKKLAAYDAAARAGIATLRAGGVADVLAAAWVKAVGARVPVPEALVVAADDELQTNLKPAAALAAIADAAGAPMLNVDPFKGLAPDGGVITVGAAAPLVGQSKLEDSWDAFHEGVLTAMVQYLPFLFGELPVGDALRAQIPVALARVLARLTSPTLLIPAGARYAGDEAGQAEATKLFEAAGGTPITGLVETSSARAIPGALIVRKPPYISLVLRPAEIDARTTVALAPYAAYMPQYQSAILDAISLVRSPDFAAMAARVTDTPVPVGGWEQDPRASVPALVDQVAKKLGVSRDAAGLYLQYLVLLWPTPKQLAVWNGWKAKQLAAAQAELVAKELVLEAKRERAQRAHFLPGGWEALKSPHPPMETWKLPLYGKRDLQGGASPTLSRFIALAPFHLMFARAWARIEAGDVPKYEDVKR